ncbi:MAG: halocarboxylic acid dehydrogenase DehI family protein [Pseudomonadota bacterium]
MGANGFRRLKPAPIPAIAPVPEDAATGRLKDVYESTKCGLGVPWMGVVAMAFARYPTFYDTLWSGLEPIVRTAAFSAACQDLRNAAEAQAAELRPASLINDVSASGYRPAELDEIRDVIEMFSSGNMPYILMATLGRLLLEGTTWSGGNETGPSLSPKAPYGRPVLMEPHHADSGTQAVFEQVKRTLDLPFVNTDYRALARWPSYFARAWQDMERIVRDPAYERAVGTVHRRARDLAEGLPNPIGLTAEQLRQAAKQDASTCEVLDVVRLFQWLLPGLAVNVACLRAQLAKPS